MNVIRSEWVKLRRASMLIVVLALAAVATFSGIATVATAGQTVPKRGLIGGAGGTSVAQITADTGLAHALSGGSTLLGVLVLGVTAALVAGEYGNGTLRNLLVREPRRPRLLLGKFAAIAIAALGAVAIAILIAVAGAVITASIDGYDVSAWGSSNGIWDTIGAGVELLGGTIGWVVFGTVLAVGFQSSVIAVVVGIVWVLPLEAIVGGLSTGAPAWLPGKLLTAIAAGGNDTATLGDAILTYGAYAIVALLAATIYFTRKDVSK